MHTLLHLLSATAHAAYEATPITVPGVRVSLEMAFSNVVGFLAVTAIFVCTSIFLVGAFFLVFYAYDENRVKTGKDIMMGAAIGLIVVLGSYGILRTVLYIIYDL